MLNSRGWRTLWNGAEQKRNQTIIRTKGAAHANAKAAKMVTGKKIIAGMAKTHTRKPPTNSDKPAPAAAIMLICELESLPAKRISLEYFNLRLVSCTSSMRMFNTTI
jgi:hypothetical protein